MKKIVILPRGWVVVGDFSLSEDMPGWCILENAAVIRRWGTTKGLGEIATNGPTKDTILDPTPTQTFPSHAVINTIDCVAKKWK